MKKGLLVFLGLILSLLFLTTSGYAEGDIQVNTYKTNVYMHQQFPSITMDSNGNYVITWTSDGLDGDSSGVYAQLYDSSGNPVGSEFQVNTYTVGNQFQPDVAMDSNGNFNITWTSSLQDGINKKNPGVYAQMFDSSGNTVGSEIHVNIEIPNVHSSQASPSIAMDSNGNYVITFNSQFWDGDGSGIYAQLYDSSGNPVGSNFQVNTYTTSSQSNPSVAMDSSGNFIITWRSYYQDGSIGGIYAQMFDSSGNTIGPEFQVNTHTTGNQDNQAVAMDSIGNFIITWSSDFSNDGRGGGIYAQLYDSSGNPVGSEFQVNTDTTTEKANPAVAMDSSGNFIITWMSGYGQDGDSAGVFAQMFDGSGNTIGSEFQVNTYTTGWQGNPAVAIDSSSNIVITWVGDSQDGNGYDVFMKLFVDQDGDGFVSGPDCNDDDSAINPDMTEVPYNGNDDDCDSTTLDDDLDSDGFMLANDCNDDDPTINPDACDIRKDGIDQDCDGFDRTKGKPCYPDDGGEDPPANVEGPGKTCKDGIDNDGDGAIDCADPDCAKRCKL